jgi:hypothetical protein
MGGKLFNLPRMPRADYLQREAEVRRYLDGRLPGAYRIPRYYGDKPDFGDMDVLIESRPDWDALRTHIARELAVDGVKAVGHVYSTSYRGLQTDFFTVPARYLDSMYEFMSFNDVGNFIGRICRRFDLKYGEHGLSYVYRRADGNYKQDIDLSQDFAQICAFLGLDHAAWRLGFPTLPAVFEWVIASRYFSVAPYLDDLAGDLARRAERPTVTRFIDYLRVQGISKCVQLADRKSYIPMVAAAFPAADLDSHLEAARAAEARQLLLRQKFDGQRVMRLCPGVTGKPLGELIVRLKASVPDFDTWLLETPQDDIDRHVIRLAALPDPR